MNFISHFKRKFILSIIYIVIATCSTYSNPFHSQPEENQPPTIRVSKAAPDFLIEWQLEFRKKIGNLLSDIKNSKNPNSIFLVLLTGFIYGVLHAAGPGHRKSVLFSIFLSKESKIWEPAAAGLLSAFLHGSSGILLILILRQITYRFLSIKLDLVTTYMETISFIVLLLFSMLLIFLHLFPTKSKNKKDNKSIFLTIAITSMFPCPGAILILILALSFDIFLIGIFTVIALSLGMGITITATAYLGKFGRLGFFNFFKSKEKLLNKINYIIELTGYCFLFIFSLWMCLPAIMKILQ